MAIEKRKAWCCRCGTLRGFDKLKVMRDGIRCVDAESCLMRSCKTGKRKAK